VRGTAVETGEDGTFAETVDATVSARKKIELSEGRSHVLAVPEGARVLVLRSGGRELERRALDLDAGDVNQIVFP